MGIARQILQQMLRSMKRRLGVDDPFFTEQCSQKCAKRLVCGDGLERSRKLKCSPAECMLEAVDELSAKHLAEDLGWEKGVTRMNPLLVIGRKPASGDHAMKVRMMLQVLPPSMQDAEKAGLRAHVRRVRSDLQQRRSASAEQQMIHDLLVVERQPGQFVRQRKDHMEVANREAFLAPFG